MRAEWRLSARLHRERAAVAHTVLAGRQEELSRIHSRLDTFMDQVMRRLMAERVCLVVRLTCAARASMHDTHQPNAGPSGASTTMWVNAYRP